VTVLAKSIYARGRGQRELLSHYAECINERARGVRIALSPADEVPFNAVRILERDTLLKGEQKRSANAFAVGISCRERKLRLAGYAVYRAAMPDTRAICTQLPPFCFAT
jgi:hypothetical protein